MISKLKSDLNSRKNYNEILEKKQLVKQSLYINNSNSKSADQNPQALYGDRAASFGGLSEQGSGESHMALESTAEQLAAYQAMLETSKNVTGMPDLVALISSYENQDSLGKLLKETLESKQLEVKDLQSQLAVLFRDHEDKKFTSKLLRVTQKSSSSTNVRFIPIFLIIFLELMQY